MIVGPDEDEKVVPPVVEAFYTYDILQPPRIALHDAHAHTIRQHPA